MKRYARTLKFWLGFIVIVIASLVHPWFPGNLFILFGAGCCAWQFYQKVKEMKHSLAKEKEIRDKAESYIHARVRKG